MKISQVWFAESYLTNFAFVISDNQKLSADGRVLVMFIGRERELAALNKLYESDKFEFVVIYGRRRVGKTALMPGIFSNILSVFSF